MLTDLNVPPLTERRSNVSTRVKANDWSMLGRPLQIGDWEPSLSVSIVIPAFQAHSTLALTLAALKAQSYPSALIEVIVANDDPENEIRLPSCRPDRTVVVADPTNWGRAHACHTGARAATGDVIFWLDADMLPYREHVESQMRWHHMLSHAVVLGHKRFVDFAVGELSPGDVYEKVRRGSADTLFDLSHAEPHDWVERRWEATSDLREAGDNAWSVHVGATASVSRRLYWGSGGMEPSLKLGEDIELGYRLAQSGAVFIPDREAQSWHLGPSTVMRRREQVNQYNRPFLANKIGLLRWARKASGRQYEVPYCEVVLLCSGASANTVQSTVEAWLASTIPDIQISLVGPWSQLPETRRHPLNDELIDMRLIRGAFASDGRVRFKEHAAPTSFPAPLRLFSPVSAAPRPDSLARLAAQMDKWQCGLMQVVLRDGAVARLERTAAFSRARLVATTGEDVDDAVADVWGVAWCDAEDVGLSA